MHDIHIIATDCSQVDLFILLPNSVTHINQLSTTLQKRIKITTRSAAHDVMIEQYCDVIAKHCLRFEEKLTAVSVFYSVSFLTALFLITVWTPKRLLPLLARAHACERATDLQCVSRLLTSRKWAHFFFFAQLFSWGAEHSGASARRETKQVLAELNGNYEKLP